MAKILKGNVVAQDVVVPGFVEGLPPDQIITVHYTEDFIDTQEALPGVFCWKEVWYLFALFIRDNDLWLGNAKLKTATLEESVQYIHTFDLDEWGF